MPLTGVYDTDEIVFGYLSPTELANLRATDVENRNNVDAYIEHLVASNRLSYISQLTRQMMGELNTLTPARVLQLWGEGRLRKSVV